MSDSMPKPPRDRSFRSLEAPVDDILIVSASSQVSGAPTGERSGIANPGTASEGEEIMQFKRGDRTCPAPAWGERP